MIPFSARTFVAKTIRVHSIGLVEVSLDLDFGVRLNKLISVSGMSAASVPERLRSSAMHCLVVLLGGKRLIVQPDPECRLDWGRLRELEARLFLDERVFGSPVGLTTNLVGDGSENLDVSMYFESLRDTNFSVDAVKNTLNRKGGDL
jgi:hypothetical protein